MKIPIARQKNLFLSNLSDDFQIVCVVYNIRTLNRLV